MSALGERIETIVLEEDLKISIKADEIGRLLIDIETRYQSVDGECDWVTGDDNLEDVLLDLLGKISTPAEQRLSR